MTTGNGKMTVLAQIAAGIAAISEANFRVPHRILKQGDTIVGTASAHIRALYTYGQNVADEVNEEAEPFIVAATRAKEGAVHAGVTSNGEFNKFLDDHPDMKAAVDKVRELAKKAEPTSNLIEVVEVLLHAEIAAAFPEIDPKHHLTVDKNWNVVYNDPLTQLRELFARFEKGEPGDSHERRAFGA